MQINKNATCKTLKELIELIEKLTKKSEVEMFNFSGSNNKDTKTEYFSVSWTEDETI